MGSGGAGEVITPVAVPAPTPPQQQPEELLEQRDEGFLAHELIDLLAGDDNLILLAPTPEKEVMTAPHAMMLPVAADPVHRSSAVTTTTTASSSSSSSSSNAAAAAAATVAVAASGTATPATVKGSKSTKGTSSQTQLGETGRENTGRWTCEEHVLFLKGLELHGKGWKKIAKLIRTRTVVQIRTHAQKYFQKLAKQKKSGHHGDMLGMDGGRFGKRVKFTGKRRGLVYGSYLVGVEATSAAISPALQPFMQQEEQEQGARAAATAAAAAALLDKEEDAAIERGLYRFLSPVVLDPQAIGALDATEPELVPPSTPPGIKAEDAMDVDFAGSELGTVVGGVSGAEADAADDASTTTGGGGPADPLPVLAKVDAAMYTKAGVPEWFRKGGDIEALLTEAAAVDWLAEAGCGGAGGLAAKGAAVLARNIEAHSSCSSMTTAATAISGVTTVAESLKQQPKQQGVKADAGGLESAPAGMMPTTAPALLAVAAAVPAPAKPAPKRKTSNGGGNKGGAGARAAAANANAVVSGAANGSGAAGNGKAAGAKSKGGGAPRKPRAPKQTKKQQAAAAAAEAAAAMAVAAAAATLATDEHDMAHDFDVAFGHHDDDHDNGLGAPGGALKEEEMDVHSDAHLDQHHHPTADTTHAAVLPPVAPQEGHPPQEHAEEHHHHDILLDDELSHIVFHSGGEGLLLLDDLAEDDDDHGIEF